MMEGRLSGIPRRIGGRSSSAGGSDGGSSVPAYGTNLGSNRLSRPLSKLSIADPKKSLSNSARRSRSETAYSIGMTPQTPQRNVVPFPRLTATPSMQHVRTPSAERKRTWQTSVDRALAGITVKDHRPLADKAWQRKQLNRLQSYFAECMQDGESGGFAQPLIPKPLTIARFVDLVSQLLAPLNKTPINVSNYVTKLPVIVKKLLYPGAVTKSWLMTVNTVHTFPQAIGLLSYLMDLNILMNVDREDFLNFLCQDDDEAANLRRRYIRQTWQIFQESNDFEMVDNEYINELMALFKLSEDTKEALEQEINTIRAHLESPSILEERAEEEQRMACLSRVKQSLQQAEKECSDQRRHNRDVEHYYTEQRAQSQQLDEELVHLKARQDSLKEKLAAQVMTIEERNKLLEDVDYSNRIIDSKQAMIAGLEKSLLDVNTKLGIAQKKTMNACVTFNENLISLENVNKNIGNVNSFIIEERDLVESSTASRMDRALKWLENKKLEIGEQIKKTEAEQCSAMRRENAYTDEIGKITKELEPLRQLRSERDKKLSDMRKRQAQEHEELQARVTQATSNARAMLDEAARTNIQLDGETQMWKDEVALWSTKVKELSRQEDEFNIKLQKIQDNSVNLRKRTFTTMVDNWTDLLNDITEG